MKNILCMIAMAGTLAAQAQTSTNTLLNHIPTDADKVFEINLGTISTKIDWTSIASLIKESNLDKKSPMKMDDMMSLMNAGIDFHGGIIVSTTDDIKDTIKYTTILLHLTDSGSFATYLKNKAHNLHILHVPGHERVAVEKDKAAAWTDHLAVIVMGKSVKPAAAIQNRLGRRAVAAIHGYDNSYFVTDPRFATAFSDDGDIHLWNRHSGGLSGMSKLLGNKGAQVDAFAQLAARSSHDATIGTIRFEAGKITYHNLKLLTPEEMAATQRISSPGMSSDLIAAIPPGELMGLLTIHYNMPEWIDSLGKMPLAAMFAGKLKDKDGKDITLPDLTHALKGSFLVLAYTPAKNDTSKMPLIYLAANIDDKTTFDRLATAIKLTDAAPTGSATANAEANATSDTTTHHKKSPFRYYTTRNGIAVIGATREEVNGFFDHPTDAANANPANATAAARLLSPRVNSNTFSLALDFHAFADFLTPMLTKADTLSEKNESLLNSLKKMDVLEWSAGALKDNAQESYVELRFTDQNKNALGSLMDIFSTLSKKKGSE